MQMLHASKIGFITASTYSAFLRNLAEGKEQMADLNQQLLPEGGMSDCCNQAKTFI